MLSEDQYLKNESIFGNDISINIYPNRPSGLSKYSAGFLATNSSSKLIENAKDILTDCIVTKNKKKNTEVKYDEYWLALFNDYYLITESAYKSAYENIKIQHSFDKILVVTGGASVYEL